MRRVWAIVALVVAAISVITLADRFVLIELLAQRVGEPLVLAFAEALAIAGAGCLARRLRPDLVLNFVVGYPLFGTLCFLVGLFRVAVWTMLPLVAILAITGTYSIIREARSRERDSGAHAPGAQALSQSGSREKRPAESRGSRASLSDRVLRDFSLIAVAVVLAGGFIAAQAPPASLDELAYHLAVPHSWAVEGRAIDLPLISHSYFPLGIESADLPLLATLGAFGGGIASHFLHLIAALATTILAWRASRHNLLLTAAIVTTPALALTAGWSLVDWPLLGVFLALASALTDDDDVTTAGAIAAGLLTKYTFIPFAIVALVVTRKHRGVLTGAIAGSVFFIRNLVLTGNPVAPFFSANAPHVASYRQLVLASYIFDGRFIDESLGASVMSAALFSTTALGIAALVMAALLFALAPSVRILVPFFGVAATRASEAVENRRLLRAILIVAIVAQIMIVGYFVDRTELFSTMSGKWSDDEYLANARASYPAVSWVNTAVPQNSRTLVVGLNETYWFARPVRGGGNFDGPRVSAYLDAPTPEALRVRLSRDGITHVAVFTTPPPTAVAQKVAERQTVLSASAQRSLAQFLDRYASNVTAHGNVTLFALK
jgi:hypothetical protein